MKLKDHKKEVIDEVIRIFSDSDIDINDGEIVLRSLTTEDASAHACLYDLEHVEVYGHRDTFNSVTGYEDKGSYIRVIDIFNDPHTSFFKKEKIIWDYFLEFSWEFEGIKLNQK